MIDPVICADGHSYERSAIEQWLRSHDTSPVTNLRLTHTMLTPNYSLKNLIESLKNHPNPTNSSTSSKGKCVIM